MDIHQLQYRISEFASERDWDQFHSPKNLASALSVEAAELLEIFQWMTTEQSRIEQLSDSDRKRAEEELADMLIYILRLADKLEIDLESAIETKLGVNAKKYPVRLAKGNATKYSRR